MFRKKSRGARFRPTAANGSRTAWAPEFFGIVDGADLPADLATNTDDHLAASGFGRDSL